MTLKEQAISLRKDGKSYKEIREVINVSKGTLSLWLKDVVLTDEQKAKLKSVRGCNQTHINRSKLKIEKNRIIGYEKAKIDTDFLLLCGLYWGEGNKADSRFRI